MRSRDPRRWRTTTSLQIRARQLRRDQTEAERVLWERLRDRRLVGAKFRRQHPIGHFIVDFCCVDHRLVVELDGTAHDGRAAEDAAREAVIVAAGFTVVRFRNEDVVADLAATLENIKQHLEAHT